MNYYIIAGFPGVGKSYVGSICSESNPFETIDGLKVVIVDMESSDYHWTYVNDNKMANLDWPSNYINAIFGTCKKSTKNVRYIPLISTHKEVLEELISTIKRNQPIIYDDDDITNDNFYIDFYNLFIVAPQPNEDCKKKYIKRYVDRGSSEDFIESLSKNYYSYLKDIESFAFDAIVYFIDGYMKDFVDFVILLKNAYIVSDKINGSGHYMSEYDIPYIERPFNFETVVKNRCYVAPKRFTLDEEYDANG